MFAIARSRALNSVVWATPPYEAEYIEAWKVSTDVPSRDNNVRYGRLQDFEIDEWLLQQGKYSPPKIAPEDKTLVGGVRLIISERRFYHPPSLSISKKSYLRIEEKFHLPHTTLPVLTDESGICARFEDYDENEPSKLRRIGMVIKAPQKYQVANYGLSLSYDFETGVTTGLLVGTGVMQGENDFHYWPKCPSEELFDLIRAASSFLAQPMLLPTILLQHHFYRAEVFCRFHLGPSYTAIQHRLGMSRAGRLHLGGSYRDHAEDKTIQETRVNLRNLTGEMSTFMTEITWYCRVSDWHLECADFLRRTLGDLAGKSTSTLASHMGERRELKECIEYLDSSVRALRHHNIGCKEVANADFGVLYSIVAQMDNRLNAKISASSSRDSTAMKTLAFITTLFLPGTFVATIFSMSMFNWQASNSDDQNGRIVSSYFWIYWAITVPLTIVVGVSWRLWWDWEKRNFDEDVRTEIENIEEAGNWTSSKEKDTSMRHPRKWTGALKTWRGLRRRKGPQVNIDPAESSRHSNATSLGYQSQWAASERT